MFGTVTAGMIADQFKHQFDITLDKKKIHLEQPIRALGDHEVELRLHPDVTTTLKVHVESTTPLPTPPPAAPEQAGKEQPRTEKRGRRAEAPAGKAEPAHAKGEAGEKKAQRPERQPRPEKAYKAEKGAKPAKAAPAEKAPKAE